MLDPDKTTWQLIFKPHQKDYWQLDPLGWFEFSFGIIKIIKHTPGTTLKRKDYRGLLIRFKYFLPFEK